MKAINCCKTMEAELTAWKANVYDIVRKMDELPGGEKEKFISNKESEKEKGHDNRYFGDQWLHF